MLTRLFKWSLPLISRGKSVTRLSRAPVTSPLWGSCGMCHVSSMSRPLCGGMCHVPSVSRPLHVTSPPCHVFSVGVLRHTCTCTHKYTLTHTNKKNRTFAGPPAPSPTPPPPDAFTGIQPPLLWEVPIFFKKKFRKNSQENFPFFENFTCFVEWLF